MSCYKLLYMLYYRVVIFTRYLVISHKSYQNSIKDSCGIISRMITLCSFLCGSSFIYFVSVLFFYVEIFYQVLQVVGTWDRWTKTKLSFYKCVLCSVLHSFLVMYVKIYAQPIFTFNEI